MSEHFDKLKKIGIQKIHENTHISRLHVEAILQEDFSAMTKIQLLGFISILEREYGLILDELKDTAIKHFKEIQEQHAGEEVKVFLAPKRKRNLTPLYITVVIFIFVSIMFITMRASSDKEEITVIDNTAIDSAKSYIEPEPELEPIIDTTPDENLTIKEPEAVKLEAQEVLEKEEITSFKIIPNAKVWLGYIDLNTYKKYQRTFKNEFDLDPSKDWILAFGHGNLKIEINGVIKKYKIKRNVRFSYVNGQLEEISLEKFKRLNKGNRW